MVQIEPEVSVPTYLSFTTSYERCNTASQWKKGIGGNVFMSIATYGKRIPGFPRRIVTVISSGI